MIEYDFSFIKNAMTSCDKLTLPEFHTIMFTDVGIDQICFNSPQSLDGIYDVASTLDTGSGGGWC